MNDLHHQLLRLDGIDYVLTESLLLDGVGEVFGNLVVDVGVKKCAAHILERLGNVYLGDFSLTFKDFETSFKFLAEVFKHIGKLKRES